MLTWGRVKSIGIGACAVVVAGTGVIACGGTVARDGERAGGDAAGGSDSVAEVVETRPIDTAVGGTAGSGVTTSDVRATRPYPVPCVGIPVTGDPESDACVGMATSGPDWERALYLLVDRTGAMAQPIAGDDQSRFDGVIAGLERFSDEYPGLGRFEGVQVFGSDESECDPALYRPLELGDPFSSLSVDGLLEPLREITPQGSGRWTVPALISTLWQSAALIPEDWIMPPTVEVVLVTGGNPSRCTPELELESVAALREELTDVSGVPPLIHVVELGTGFDLTEIAEVGGTSKVFSVQKGDLAEQLARVFYAIFWGDMGIPLQFSVPQPPNGRPVIPESGRLFYGEYEAPRVDDMTDCATSPHGGWWYTDDSVMLCDCTAIEATRHTDLRIMFECAELH